VTRLVVEFEDDEFTARCVKVVRTDTEDFESPSPETVVVGLRVIELLLLVTERCVSVVFGNTDCISDDVMLDKVRGVEVGDPLLRVFGERPCASGVLFPAMVEFAGIELEDTESTFDSVKLAVVGDGDGNSPVLESFGTKLRVIELLLPVVVGCTGIGMGLEGSALEFFTVGDVSTAFKDSDVGAFDLNDAADTTGFEDDGTTLIVIDVMPFTETVDVKFIVRELSSDLADVVFDDTRTETVGEAPEVLEKVSDREELLTRLVNKLPGPLEVSLVVGGI
jgi:hypothetical protein